MKKIVIAGASSYIAYNLIENLSKIENVLIYALVRPKSEKIFRIGIKENVKIIQVDMYDFDKLKDYIKESCDVFIDFAWQATRGELSRDKDIQNCNRINSLKLKTSLKDLNIKKFIHIGSLAEYGSVSKEIVETTNCKPMTPYGKAKYETGLNLSEWCVKNNVQFLWLRLGSVYGKNMETNTLLYFVINTLKKEESCKVSTNCIQEWEFIHIDDVIHILIKAIYEDNIKGIYNVSTGEHSILKKYLKTIENKFNKTIIYPTECLEKFGCENIMCNVSKLKNDFNISSFIKFDEGINDMVNKD